jgi:hypothetical protein
MQLGNHLSICLKTGETQEMLASYLNGSGLRGQRSRNLTHGLLLLSFNGIFRGGVVTV